MIEKETGKPAFPATAYNDDGHMPQGMSVREYAAIKLRVPDSGTDWLDDMIRKSQRDEIAAKAMQSFIGDPYLTDHSREECAQLSYAMADAMLRTREAS
jgi:hypothetical protein